MEGNAIDRLQENVSPISSGKLHLENPKQVLNPELQQARNTIIRGTYDPVSRVIELVKGRADVSTVVHELGHYFHHILLDHPEWGNTIRSRYGDITNTEGAERFARHYEGYFRTGQAPNSKLATVFHAISSWMKEIYSKSDDGKVDPHVKAIFDKVHGEVSPATRRLIEDFHGVHAGKNLVPSSVVNLSNFRSAQSHGQRQSKKKKWPDEFARAAGKK